MNKLMTDKAGALLSLVQPPPPSFLSTRRRRRRRPTYGRDDDDVYTHTQSKKKKEEKEEDDKSCSDSFSLSLILSAPLADTFSFSSLINGCENSSQRSLVCGGRFSLFQSRHPLRLIGFFFPLSRRSSSSSSSSSILNSAVCTYYYNSLALHFAFSVSFFRNEGGKEIVHHTSLTVLSLSLCV